ncbi:MAG: hypothetical protein ABDK78_00470 [Atribacterota bacterium]
MPYKNKKNLYKIIFITILLGFIISSAGCNWLSLGLLNIFDPQAQVQIKNFKYTEDKYKNSVTFDVFTINQVSFNITGFELEYYRGSTKLDLKNKLGANYYVAPSSGPGVEGTPTQITDLCLYSEAVKEYVKAYSAFNEITCDLYMLGTDGAGHNLKIKVAEGLAALGIDNTLPEAKIKVIPETGGDCPLTVIFDGSGSNDKDGIGIAKYEWYVDISDSTTSFTKTDVSFNYTFSCDLVKDTDEVITVSLTVTDYHGNEGSDAKTIPIHNPGSTSDGGCS